MPKLSSLRTNIADLDFNSGLALITAIQASRLITSTRNIERKKVNQTKSADKFVYKLNDEQADALLETLLSQMENR